MGRFSGNSSRHWMNAKWDVRAERPFWVGVSEWDMYYPNSRLRWPRSTSNVMYDEKAARRWARRYKTEFPGVATAPEGDSL